MVKVTKYLTDMRDMDGMVAVLAEYFGDWTPATHHGVRQSIVDARRAGRAGYDRGLSEKVGGLSAAKPTRQFSAIAYRWWARRERAYAHATYSHHAHRQIAE